MTSKPILSKNSSSFYIFTASKNDNFSQIRPAKQDKDLFCFHLHHNNPYLILGPFKYERLHKALEIGLFHDFATENEMTAIKSHAR